VTELAEPFPITVQAVSRHVRVLEDAGLITRGRTAQQRPSRLRGEPLGSAVAWLQRYRPFWEDGFDRLEERLRDE
jgi:DNA-binding transcriptional ArsR family regulator